MSRSLRGPQHMLRARARRALGGLAALTLLVPLTGCPTRPLETPPPRSEKQETKYYPQSIEKDVDILFVIDNSGSMEQEQVNLQNQFGNLIEALKSDKLNGKIPNVHIGVVSSDLGAGNYSLPSCEIAGGDGGKLQNKAQVAGCTPPSQKWISYNEGTTNVPNCTKDGVECVKDAFKCIARLGTSGCGFEAQLESARRALDPKLNLNPGFVRPDAFLAIVFITDEDDCSARNPQLFDPSQQGLTDPLGPLTSFRCFEFGVQCDINDRNRTGPRTNCVPAFDWLYKVDAYIDFFKKLKPSEDRVIMAAIAGPVEPVAVGKDGNNPVLKPSCQTSAGFAVPGIRLKKVIDAFGGQYSSICTNDFGPALKALGEKIVASLGGQCIGSPLLLPSGSLACAQNPKIPLCKASCLNKVDCIIEEVPAPGQPGKEVKKCSDALFNNVGSKDCGSECPCWRIVPRPDDCTADLKVTPFGLEIMRKGDPPKGTVAVARCKAATYAWGSPELSALAQCQ